LPFFPSAGICGHVLEGDDGALDRRHVEEGRNGGDLIRFVAHLGLRQDEASSRREGRLQMDPCPSRARLIESADRHRLRTSSLRHAPPEQSLESDVPAVFRPQSPAAASAASAFAAPGAGGGLKPLRGLKRWPCLVHPIDLAPVLARIGASDYAKDMSTKAVQTRADPC
jgi:hypothetical protein